MPALQQSDDSDTPVMRQGRAGSEVLNAEPRQLLPGLDRRLWTTTCHTERDTVDSMVKAVSVRLDDDALRALARLEASGLTRSQAIRSALIETADRRQRAAAMRDEAAAVAADAHDRREMAAVASLMEDLRDPW